MAIFQRQLIPAMPRRLAAFGKAAVALLFVGASIAPIWCHAASDNVDEPVSLVVTYKCRPEARVALRTYMEDRGVRKFEEWQRAGVFKEYHVLFNAYAGFGTVDMVVILDFDRETATARWRDVERKMPAGLGIEQLGLGVTVDMNLAHKFGRGLTNHQEKALFEFSGFTLLSDPDKFGTWFENYIVPQEEAQMKEGMLGGYVYYVNINRKGVPWDVIHVLQFSDASAYARLEHVEEEVRRQLGGTDPTWKKYRTEKIAHPTITRNARDVIAEQILPTQK